MQITRILTLTILTVGILYTSKSEARRGWGSGGGGRGGEFRMGARLEMMAKELQLDKRTRKQIESIFVQTRAEARAMKQRIRPLKRSMKELLFQDNANEAEIMARIDEIGALRTKLRKLRVKTLLRVRQLLTPAQRAKLRNMRQQKREVIKRNCAPDIQKFCGAASGRGIKKRCLFKNFDQLSPQCKKAVKKFKHHRRGRRGHGRF